MSDSKSHGDGTPYAMPVPSVMLVAVDDATAKLSQGALPALHIRVPNVQEAKWRIPVARPLVIATGVPLDGAAMSELQELARGVGAVVVRLDTCLLPGDVRERLMTAWRAAGAKR